MPQLVGPICAIDCVLPGTDDQPPPSLCFSEFWYPKIAHRPFDFSHLGLGTVHSTRHKPWGCWISPKVPRFTRFTYLRRTNTYLRCSYGGGVKRPARHRDMHAFMTRQDSQDGPPSQSFPPHCQMQKCRYCRGTLKHKLSIPPLCYTHGRNITYQSPWGIRYRLNIPSVAAIWNITWYQLALSIPS